MVRWELFSILVELSWNDPIVCFGLPCSLFLLQVGLYLSIWSIGLYWVLCRFICIVEVGRYLGLGPACWKLPYRMCFGGDFGLHLPLTLISVMCYQSKYKTTSEVCHMLWSNSVTALHPYLLCTWQQTSNVYSTKLTFLIVFNMCIF